jgi:opacity protein-like surface antigen
MSLKQSLQPLSRFRAAAVVLSLMAGVAVIPACAQQAQTATLPAITSGFSIQNLQLFSSSAAGTQDDATLGAGTAQIGPNADANPQYGGGYGGPPRRRPYGRPTYRDRYTNADGSSKIAWEAGAGFTVPTQTSGPLLSPSYKFNFGGGRAFNKNFAVLVEYSYDHFGIPNPQVLNEMNVLNQAITYYNSTQPPANQVSLLTQLNGNAHTWSFTLEPVLSIYSRGKTGAYVIGGGGFYRKITNFTTPTTAEECDYYSCYEYSANQTVQDFSNNAGGLNIGAGLTYKVSSFSNLKLFAEARYVWVDNSPSSNNATTGYPQYGYPPANFQTEYIPVTFGVRF